MLEGLVGVAFCQPRAQANGMLPGLVESLRLLLLHTDGPLLIASDTQTHTDTYQLPQANTDAEAVQAACVSLLL